MIAHTGLSVGNHSFSVSFADDFFSEIPESEVVGGSGVVGIDVVKTANMLTISIAIDGSAKVACDRCLEDVEMPISFNGDIIVKFSYEVQEPTFDDGLTTESDLLLINPADDKIDLKQYIYESIVLSLPYSRIHPDDENGVSTCNPEMLERFTVATGFDIEDYDDEDEDDGYDI